MATKEANFFGQSEMLVKLEKSSENFAHVRDYT